MAALPSRVLQKNVVSLTRTCLPFQENQTGLISPREKIAPTFMGSLISTAMMHSIVNVCSLVKGQEFSVPGIIMSYMAEITRMIKGKNSLRGWVLLSNRSAVDF